MALRCVGDSQQCREQRALLQNSIVTLAIDEESRRCRHAAAHGPHEVALDAGPIAAGLQIRLESRDIQSQLTRQLVHQIRAQIGLLLEESIVHFPELALRAGRLCRLGGILRVRMHLGERHVAEDETQLRTHPFGNGLNHRMYVSAVRALIVAIFNQSDRSVFRALRMVALADSHGKSHCSRDPQSASFPLPRSTNNNLESCASIPTEGCARVPRIKIGERNCRNRTLLGWPRNTRSRVSVSRWTDPSPAIRTGSVSSIKFCAVSVPS